MIAIAIFGIVATAIYSIFSSSMKAHVSQENSLELNQELRAALNLMATEIRMAGYDPEGTAGAGFLADGDDKYNTDTNSIRFTMDLNDGLTPPGDPDGDVMDTGEDINYFVNTNGELIRRIDGLLGRPVEAVAAGSITNLTFTYYDADNNTTNILADIRSVLISLTGQTTDPLLRTSSRTKTDTVRVKVRNLGL
jgi:type IV pilus assembly protein PilW